MKRVGFASASWTANVATVSRLNGKSANLGGGDSVTVSDNFSGPSARSAGATSFRMRLLKLVWDSPFPRTTYIHLRVPIDRVVVPRLAASNISKNVGESALECSALKR